MGTHVQKIFFLDTWELFIDELSNECFHLQKNAKKNLKRWSFFFNYYFKCFVRQKIEVFWGSGKIWSLILKSWWYLFKNPSLLETVVPPTLWLSYYESVSPCCLRVGRWQGRLLFRVSQCYSLLLSRFFTVRWKSQVQKHPSASLLGPFLFWKTFSEKNNRLKTNEISAPTFTM